MREAVEKLLVAFDWAESFLGLNLVLKPMIDDLFLKHVSDLALREDDYLLGQIFFSLNEDCQWHRQWSESLIQTVIEDNSENRKQFCVGFTAGIHMLLAQFTRLRN